MSEPRSIAEMIFEYDEIKAMFMNVVKQAKKKYDFNLKNYFYSDYEKKCRS
jgi:hypothetical protein